MRADYCRACDYGMDQCLGCGDHLPHGQIVCVECALYTEQEKQQQQQQEPTDEPQTEINS